LVGLGDVAGNLPGVFVLFAGDGAELGVGAAPVFGRASLTASFQRPVFGDALAPIVAAKSTSGVS